MTFKFKCGLYVGRFQPLHYGHMDIIDQMLTECEKVIVAVGSAQESGTMRNPLTYSFRKQLIREVYFDYLDKIEVVPINDREKYSDDFSWGIYLFERIHKQCGLCPDVIYEGEEHVRAHWYDECNVPVIKVSRTKRPVSGTMIRNMFVNDRKGVMYPYVPNTIYFNHYEEIRKEIQNARINTRCNPLD